MRSIKNRFMLCNSFIRITFFLFFSIFFFFSFITPSTSRSQKWQILYETQGKWSSDFTKGEIDEGKTKDFVRMRIFLFVFSQEFSFWSIATCPLAGREDFIIMAATICHAPTIRIYEIALPFHKDSETIKNSVFNLDNLAAFDRFNE